MKFRLAGPGDVRNSSLRGMLYIGGTVAGYRQNPIAALRRVA
jgi:hypothetical protein